MHAGVIRGALILDMVNVPDLNTISILTAGKRGQLPNLDLVNAAVRACSDEGIDTTMDR